MSEKERLSQGFPAESTRHRASSPSESSHSGSFTEPPIPIDGFRQILEMLQIADPSFRESLLKRLAAKDFELARSLRQDLRDLGF